MKKSPSPSIRAPLRRHLGGFTLVELLVAMAVLVLIMAVIGQIAALTGSTLTQSSRNIATETMASAVLDRMGDELSAMVTSGSATLVAIKNNQGSDGLAFLSNSRVEDRGYTANTVRLSAVGFGVAPQIDYSATSSSTTGLPMVCEASGAVIFSGNTGNGSQIQPNVGLQNAAGDVMTWMTATGPVTSAGQELGVPEPLSTGAFRVEVCFLRSDGQLISATVPPLNKNFVNPPTTTPTTPTPPVVFAAPQYPLAFKPSDSNDTTNQTYIRAIVVGIAVVDPQTQKQLSSAQLNELASTSTFPKTVDNQTPLQAWDFSSTAGSSNTYAQLKAISPVALQYVHIYQRYFYVN